ncbi:MAG: mannose-ethanolamine phosphotransferase gpi13 [Sclerophora amabilis]|nr:MAG: mannose-ethanolamine phosphotransferase gpi13 [Sclerophora amabilis]
MANKPEVTHKELAARFARAREVLRKEEEENKAEGEKKARGKGRGGGVQGGLDGIGAGLNRGTAGAGAGAESTRKRAEFMASHGLLVGVLVWVFFIHVLGIYFFTKGFLLTRLVLDHKSDCKVLPTNIAASSHHSIGSPSDGCWHPKSFEKAIVIIVDALRYDFTVPYTAGTPHHYHNAFPLLHETASKQPANAFLLPFIADPPTATLQRLKGLTTGTLPTFVDVGSNFAGTAIEEDNLVSQLRDAGKNLVHLGDDTWHSLFPGYFDANLTRSYDSFNVWDLHTVDNGVMEHLVPLMQPANLSRWDVIFGHFLGVDHAGHRYGPDHPAMMAKLHQMDVFFREVIDLLDESTLLVVMGDHGMDVKGDHGGESDDEVEAALWMYSKRPLFGRSSEENITPPRTAKERPVGQIDLVPTLSLLLGIPIPFNNLGAPIEEAFIGKDGSDWQNLALVNHLAGGQIKRYQHEYALARGLDDSVTSKPLRIWDDAIDVFSKAGKGHRSTATVWRDAYTRFSNYQRETLSICRSLWARFDLVSMGQGIGILLTCILLLVTYAGGYSGDIIRLNPVLLLRVTAGTGLGVVSGFSVAWFLPDVTSNLDGILFGSAAGGLAGVAFAFFSERTRLSSPLPNTVWGWFSLVSVIGPSIGFASNSYTIWEDDILLFFISTFGFLAIVSSFRQKDVVDRTFGTYQSLIFLVLTRLSSFSRLCREEQMPYCRSTYYASTTSSTSAPWQLLIPFVFAIFLPGIIKSYYQSTRSYEGSAIFWIGFAFRIGLLLTAVFWTLDAADDGDWFAATKRGLLKTVRMSIAQLVLAIALAAGSTTFAWAKPCVNIQMTSPQQGSGSINGAAGDSSAPRSTLTILGYANTFGTHYFLLFTNVLLAVLLLTKPMGHLSLGLLTWQILSLLDLLDANHLLPNTPPTIGDPTPPTSPAIGPTILSLLGSYHFFKTGHQATIASIQWDSAFIPLRTIHYPWTPILVVANTFGAPILTALAVPLLVLWKRTDPKQSTAGPVIRGPPKQEQRQQQQQQQQRQRQQPLLADVARSMTTFLLCHATVACATTVWAAWLRRHLMLYRVFMPRFMLGALVLCVVDLVGILIAVGVGVRASVGSVGEVFGWG